MSEEYKENGDRDTPEDKPPENDKEDAKKNGHIISMKEAVSTLRRMVDMGGEPYIIGEAVKLIVAQRGHDYHSRRWHSPSGIG